MVKRVYILAARCSSRCSSRRRSAQTAAHLVRNGPRPERRGAARASPSPRRSGETGLVRTRGDRPGRALRHRRSCRRAPTRSAPSWPASSRTSARRCGSPSRRSLVAEHHPAGRRRRHRRRRHRRDRRRSTPSTLGAQLPGRRRSRSSRSRSTAATTPTWRCCSPASSPSRTATAARSSPTASG